MSPLRRRPADPAVAPDTDDRDGPRAGDHRSELDELLVRVAGGDEHAFAELYDRLAGPVLGLARRVLRDPAQAEEVAQEVLVELWRTAGRFDPQRGSARGWVLTMTHRRAVDRVRSAQASADRDLAVGSREHVTDYDVVSETVTTRLEQEEVRQALGELTDLQREALTLAYYGGYTHREVSELLHVPLGTVKTRLRDGLLRLRDALGVA
jgi:RNA polymerase sigma-70 factor, ECF subfamily